MKYGYKNNLYFNMSLDYRRTFYSPINNSSSKQLYSFSKSNRFQPTRRSECKQSFYEIKKGSLEKRATTFGFGDKATFASSENVPFGTYNKDNEFSINKIKKKGYAFGKDDNRSLINNPYEARNFPGPGSYVSIDQKHKTGYGSSFQNVSFSMRGKYEDPLQRLGNVFQKIMKQLGPGQYNAHGNLSERGHYYNTRFPSSNCRKIGNQARFQQEKVESPGPGHYKPESKTNLNGTGTYFQTKYATMKANAFGRSERPSPAKNNQAPDPGHYHRFTDFALINKKYGKPGYK